MMNEESNFNQVMDVIMELEGAEAVAEIERLNGDPAAAVPEDLQAREFLVGQLLYKTIKKLSPKTAWELSRLAETQDEMDFWANVAISNQQSRKKKS